MSLTNGAFEVMSVGESPPKELSRYLRKKKWSDLCDYLDRMNPLVWHRIKLESGYEAKLAQQAIRNWVRRTRKNKDGGWGVTSHRDPSDDKAKPGYLWLCKHRKHESPPYRDQ